MELGFDFHELTDFKKGILQLGKEDFPKETKKFVKKSAVKLSKLSVDVAKSKLKKKTGNYLKGFKSGKVYIYSGDFCCRTYNGSPHAHLIEYGHNKITQKTKRNLGFVEGKYVLKEATNKFERIFENDVEALIEAILDKGKF